MAQSLQAVEAVLSSAMLFSWPVMIQGCAPNKVLSQWAVEGTHCRRKAANIDPPAVYSITLSWVCMLRFSFGRQHTVGETPSPFFHDGKMKAFIDSSGEPHRPRVGV